MEKKGGSGRDGQIRKQQVCVAVSPLVERVLKFLLPIDRLGEAKVRRGDPELPGC